MKTFLNLCFALLFLAAAQAQQQLAIVVGTGVKLRSAANNTTAKVITEVNTHDVLRILDETEEYVYLPGKEISDCWKYKWYKVETSGGKQGWTYGQNIFFLEAYEKFQAKPMTFNGKKYRLFLSQTRNYGLAAGTLDCANNYHLFLLQDNSQKGGLIAHKQEEYKGFCAQSSVFSLRDFFQIMPHYQSLKAAEMKVINANTVELVLHTDLRGNQNDESNRYYAKERIQISQKSDGSFQLKVVETECE